MNKNNIYKIIYKYKNINKNIQYDIFIFLGITNTSIIDILNIIKNYSFLDVLTKLNSNYHLKLIEYYGDNWYNNFFTYHHINNIFNDIKINKMKSFIIKNLDIEIYNKYFSNYIDKKNIEVGYNNIINNNLYLNYIKKKNINNIDINLFNNFLIGGNNDNNEFEEINLNDIIDINEDIEIFNNNNIIN